MIDKRIVLVLGAGASAPFGFPSGRKLRNEIINDLGTGSTALYKVLSTSGADAKQITNFRVDLQQSGQASVDAFLEHRSEYRAMGKIAIAAALIPYEKEETLWSGEDSWYEHLFNRLGPTLDDIRGSQLRVITFNYDRSFEHYFFSALRKSYNIGTDQAADIVHKILRVVHVHGKLGPLPWEDKGSGDGRAYRPAELPDLRDLAVAAARAIKIVPESSEGDDAFGAARQLLGVAQSVIFLGFGYLPKNVERLGIARLSTNVALTGTTFGLLPGERESVSKLLGAHSSLGHPELDVLKFFRTHRLLE